MDYSQPVSEESIARTSESLSKRNFTVHRAHTKTEALEAIKQLIPAGASVMNGASRTLEQIGYIDYLKAGAHGWNNLHEAVVAEQDPVKKAALRKQAVLSDFYLGSVHAIAESGEIVIASNTGSQLPHIVFTSPNVIFVIGTQKITPTLQAALDRVETYVFPLEDNRMKEAGMGGSFMSKLLTFYGEKEWTGRKFHVIFVDEALGF